MNVQSAISKCDMARAILLALVSYKKTTTANPDVIQSLSFAAETFLDDAKKASSNQELSQEFIPENIPNNKSTSISFRIQLARENLGLTEADVARELGIYSDHISDWECGITELPAGMVIPLANALKCDPLWLLGDFDGIEPPALTEAPLAPVKIMQGVDMSTIGKRIRDRRNELSMSVMQLAANAETHLMDVINWESGLAKPRAEQIDTLAKALNTSVTWLLTGRQIVEKDA